MKNLAPALCSSAQPVIEGGVAFGVVDYAADGLNVAWIEQPVPVTPELLEMTATVSPTRVFRFAAKCQEGACAHFDGADCRLASRLVASLAPVTAKPPPCVIRSDCRWYRQEGVSACMRCPQIVTEYVEPSSVLAKAARPDNRGKDNDCAAPAGRRLSQGKGCRFRHVIREDYRES